MSLRCQVVVASKEKNKPKKSYKNTLINQSDLESSIEPNHGDFVINNKSSSLLEEIQQTKGGCPQPNQDAYPKETEKGGSSKPPRKMDASSFFNKLSKGNMKKFNLWFEDIPQGCGSCGETDHSFTSCPLRKFIPPKFKITFKKPATGGYSVQIHESDDSGWKEVENKGKNKAETSNPLKENKGKQLDDFGGIGVIYITDDSSNEFQTGIEIDKHQAGQPVTTPCGDPIPNNTENQEEEVASPGNVAFATVDPNLFLLPPTIDQEDIMANQHYFEEFKKEQELDGADNNLFYYQEDENEVWANDQGDCIFEDQPYVEETTEANFNINNCQDLPVEDNSFHSLNSDNSMLKHLADMELMKAGQSTSGSGKRKINGGDGDTASSDLVGVKKPKI